MSKESETFGAMSPNMETFEGKRSPGIPFNDSNGATVTLDSNGAIMTLELGSNRANPKLSLKSPKISVPKSRDTSDSNGDNMSIDYSGLSRLLSVSRSRNISDSNGEIDSINLVRQKCVSNSRDTSDSNGGQVSKLSDSNGEINIPIVSQSEVSTSNSVAFKAFNIELINSSDCKETKSQTHPLDGCSSCDVIRETKSIKSPSNGTSEVDLSDRKVKNLCDQ